MRSILRGDRATRKRDAVYLITVKYDSDSERKRVEYVFDKWRDRMGIGKPEGIIAIVEKDSIEELVTDLYSRIDRSSVSLFRVEEASLALDEEERELSVRLTEKKETAEKLIGFIMARQRAVLKFERTEPWERIYEAITKKGRAEISIGLRDDESGVVLHLRTTGYGDAVELLFQRLSEELRVLEGRR